ncbi:MAG: pyridoxamine 5'-phosphate oxidase family protein [Rhodovarius sp.]|nr:pyridoxamine 5'-phosphate oxidase family protein [Rhodovarius sp.]
MSADHAFAARCLLRAAASATLATQRDGQPFASLVTHAVAPDGSLLLWLSALAQHTRQLEQEPRCALLAQGAASSPNPQTAPRVTVTGLARRIEDPRLKARWLARHPYAALYAEFADFALWRIEPQGALLVGGFAAAHRIRAEALRPDPAAVAAIEAAEPEIIAHVNAEHADALALIAGSDAGWRLSAVDVDGCDLTAGEVVFCLAFPAPVSDAEGVRKALILAARRARAGQGAG